jgi:hypothetical protein
MIITSHPTLPQDDEQRETEQEIRSMWPDGYDTGKYGWGLFIRYFPDLAGRYYNPTDAANTLVWLYGDRLEKVDFIHPPNLSHAMCNETSFYGSYLINADLSHALFYECDFTKANLFGVNVSYSTFIGCTFYHARLDGVEWEQANLIRRCKGLPSNIKQL